MKKPGSCESIQNQVPIRSAFSRKTRMKILIDIFRPGYIDVIRKIRVDAKQPAPGRSFCRGVEVGNLASGVYTGVRAASADGFYGLIGHNRERTLNQFLHAGTRLLTLPANIACTVILDA
jgi:hypothetical protein